MKYILLTILLVPIIALSQKTITGKVFDALNNQPLASASIRANGSNTGIVTNNEGIFNLKINNSIKTIIVSYAGYETQVIKIGDTGTNYSIGLQPSQGLAEVKVIGSRNLSRTKVQSPVPVDVIPVASMVKDVAQVDLNQFLTYAAPSFQSSRQTVADGTDHIDPAQLRGLGSDQVLVLINGKRYHQSALVNVNGTVNRGQVGTDLGTIPLSSIERVEVLRDGASAQYGSDAIAGVINIVLRKSTHSLNGNISLGENVTSYTKDFAVGKLSHTSVKDVNVQDGGTFKAGLNYGFNLGNKGFINLTGEYSMRNESNRAGTYTGAVYPSLNGVNKDDSILNARSLTRNDFDMRIGNSKISNGIVNLNAVYALGQRWNLKVFRDFSQKNGEAAGFFRYPTSINSSAAIYAGKALALYRVLNSKY